MYSYWDYAFEEPPELQVAGRFPFADRGFSVCYSGSSTALHLHDYTGAIRFEEKVIELNPGDITISPPASKSYYDLHNSGYHLCLHFKSIPGAAKLRLPLHFAADTNALRYRRKFEEIISLHGGNEVHAFRARLILQELLLDLAECCDPAQRGLENAADKIAEAARLLRERLHRQQTISALAREVDLSVNYLARKFQARYGVTMQQYQTCTRMEYAMFLLRNSSLTVKEIGVRCGVPDPQYFNKLFRRHVGVSPSAFRE